MGEFQESVDTFLKQATWLNDSDAPMIASIKQAAKELDNSGVQAALLNTFGVAYRTLLKRRNSTADDVSEEDAFLDSL